MDYPVVDSEMTCYINMLYYYIAVLLDLDFPLMDPVVVTGLWDLRFLYELCIKVEYVL